METLSYGNDIVPSVLGLSPAIFAVIIVWSIIRRRRWESFNARCSNRIYIFLMATTIVGLAVAFYFLQPKMRWGGSDRYFARAANIVEHGIYGTGNEPSAWFPPGYSFLLVPLTYVLEGSRWSFFLTNIILLASSTIFFRWFFITLRYSEGLANVFSLLIFLYPNRLLSTLLPFSDVPFSLLFAGAFCCMLISERSQTKFRVSLLTGALAGVATLVRSNGIMLLLPLLTGYLVAHEVSWGQRWRNVMLAFAVACAVLLPWTLRNYMLFHRVIPISNNGGLNLAEGNNPTNPIVHNNYFDSVWAERSSWVQVGGENWNEAQRDSFFADVGIRYIQQHPTTTLVLGIQRVLNSMAADSYSFGVLETYTNMRTLIFGVIGEANSRNLLRVSLWSVYKAAYQFLFIANNTFYYSLILLVAFALMHRIKGSRSAKVSFLLLTASVWLIIFFTQGVSRYKEPISALLPLVVCILLIRPSVAADK